MEAHRPAAELPSSSAVGLNIGVLYPGQVLPGSSAALCENRQRHIMVFSTAATQVTGQASSCLMCGFDFQHIGITQIMGIMSTCWKSCVHAKHSRSPSPPPLRAFHAERQRRSLPRPSVARGAERETWKLTLPCGDFELAVKTQKDHFKPSVFSYRISVAPRWLIYFMPLDCSAMLSSMSTVLNEQVLKDLLIRHCFTYSRI